MNTRTDGSWGALTIKHEMESYLHADATRELLGIEIEVLDHPGADGKAVPKVFGEAFVVHRGHGMPLKDSTAKQKLAEAFARMTIEQIRERDLYRFTLESQVPTAQHYAMWNEDWNQRCDR